MSTVQSHPPTAPAEDWWPHVVAGLGEHAEAVSLLSAECRADPGLGDVAVVHAVEHLIARIDELLDAQIHTILHHPEFQAIEATWRGLFYAVYSLRRADVVRIRVLDISKNELRKTLRKFKGFAWDQSPIFKMVYEEEYGTPGGEPYGCLVGDYDFSHIPPDVEILGEMAKIAAAAHAPFISAASPSLLNMDTWQQLADPRDLTKLARTPEYAPWRSLRASEDSRYLGLTLPRFLGRIPYGIDTDPVDDFDFEERVEAKGHERYLWASSAYAFAVVIGRAFARHGWCSQIRGIESGGLVEDLPSLPFETDDGGIDRRCPTEIAITARREAELAQFGLIPLCHVSNSDAAVFVGAHSLQEPAAFTDDDATKNAVLSSRLPYIFPTCRFAHYIKCMVRDRVGSYQERDDLERWLNDWLQDYVTSNAQASEEVKAERPLAHAEVAVEEVPGQPGQYSCKMFLRPHFQLEGLTGSLRLVSRLATLGGAG